MEWIKSIRSLYRKSRRTLLYIDLVFVVVLFYAGKYFVPLRDHLLPAAIASAFLILLETLFAISDSLQDKIGVMQYTSLSQALPKMADLVSKCANGKHTVKVIASTGGTTINSIIPTLLDHLANPIELSLVIINPDLTRLSPHLPRHWAQEAGSTIARLEDHMAQCDPRVTITCHTYDYIPCVHGVLIDGQHLFLGFFMWVKSGNRVMLSGSQQPHVYYRRAPAYENLFRLFETWFDDSPRKQVISSTVGPSDPSRSRAA
jgi:hypothetical protein